MKGKQFLSAPFLDSPEKTVYSEARWVTVQKVQTAREESFAAQGHSSLSPT